MLYQIEPKTIVAAGALCALLLAEHQFPFFLEFWPNKLGRIRHDAKNLSLGLTNAIVAALLTGTLLVVVEAASRDLGLLSRLSLPVVAATAISLVILDFWMYVWHRLNHALPFLWRFHRMHHSDPAVDASTGVRFHTGEIVMSGLARVALLPVLGFSLWQLALYDAMLLPVVLFHHSNVRFPRWLDYGLTMCVVTPAMHRVHHSQWRPETDSNFASILPLWDRMFRTFRLREDAHSLRLGLVEFEGQQWQTLWGMLKTPVARSNREKTAQEQSSA
jgi:sterol desaturase/sphingolipid hydroxylase (fatty acid hydroxylase superfamily)